MHYEAKLLEYSVFNWINICHDSSFGLHDWFHYEIKMKTKHFIPSFFWFSDPPEIEIEQNWYEREGVVEVEIICVVHANPEAEVSNTNCEYINIPELNYFKCVFNNILSTIFNTRSIGLRDRKSYTKQTERYSRKRLEETHCISEMYNPLILEITHAEQIMS